MLKRIATFVLKFSGLIGCAALMLLYYSNPMQMVRSLAGDIHIQKGESIRIPFSGSQFLSASAQDDALAVSMQKGETLAEVTGSTDNNLDASYKIQIKLFDMIPIKEINVHVRSEIKLIPGGSSIGVELHTKGALVVGVSTITLSNGQQISPAAAAGIQAGDIVEKINGVEIKDSKHMVELCNVSKDSIEATILRGNERQVIIVKPAMDPEGLLRMGMWVRDSTAGVGTLSFYDPISQWYAALGHAITDVDTRSPLTVREGEILQSAIVDIIQGAQGEPGELRGTFNSSSLPLGTIEVNSQYGIYGRMYQPYRHLLYPDGLLMAYPEEAKLGPAKLLTTLSENGIQAFDCNIIKLNPQSTPSQKGMVLEITDKTLLDATGGIVQGMSGSPIIQDGKLIGVVTHVFINDPTKGYCMFAQWMYEQLG